MRCVTRTRSPTEQVAGGAAIEAGPTARLVVADAMPGAEAEPPQYAKPHAAATHQQPAARKHTASLARAAIHYSALLSSLRLCIRVAEPPQSHSPRQLQV